MAGHKIKQLSDLRASNHNKTWSSFQILEFAHLITRAKKEILLPHIYFQHRWKIKICSKKNEFCLYYTQQHPYHLNV